MTTLRADRRRIEVREDPEGERLASEGAARYLDARIAMARALARIGESGTYHLRGCSSVVHYAVRLGIPAADARMLVHLGRVLDVRVPAATTEPAAAADGAEPASSASVEERIRAGAVHVENASLVAQVLEEPGLARAGEDWIGWAASMATPTLRRFVNARLEEAAQGTRALLRIDVHVTARTREGFERARVVASREAGRVLTQGQTFALVVDRYLDARDETRRGAGQRRIGPTSESPGERYVPAEVRREVLARSGDRCEVPWCTFGTFLELAHVEAHAAGGSREAENLLRLCHVHHTQLDAGCLAFGGWSGRRPVFRETCGRRIDTPLDSEARSAGWGQTAGSGECASPHAADGGSDEALRVDAASVESPPRADGDAQDDESECEFVRALLARMAAGEDVERDGSEERSDGKDVSDGSSGESRECCEGGEDPFEVAERPPPYGVLRARDGAPATTGPG